MRWALIYGGSMGLLLRLREARIMGRSPRDDAEAFCPVCRRLVPPGEGVKCRERRCCTVEHAEEWFSDTAP